LGSGGQAGDIGWARWPHVSVHGPTLQWQRAVNLRRKGRTALLTRIEEQQETVPEEAPRQTTPQAGASVQPAGVFTMILLRSLEERLSVDEIQDLLRRAGETRTLAEFKETAESTSIEQFTRLRHEATLVLGPRLNRRL
jgi:hypothetical protein